MTHKALWPVTFLPFTTIPSINTVHRSFRTTSSCALFDTAVKFDAISPTVKIPPSVAPVDTERDNWKEMNSFNDGSASNTFCKKKSPSKFVDDKVVAIWEREGLHNQGKFETLEYFAIHIYSK